MPISFEKKEGNCAFSFRKGSVLANGVFHKMSMALALAGLAGAGLPTVRAEDAEPHEQRHEVHRHEPHHPVRAPGPHGPIEQHRCPDDFSKPWWEWEHTTGDWAGARPWLDDRGLTLDIGYSADYFTNTYGGIDTSNAHVYRGLLDISLTVDTETMGLWEGGTFFIDFQNIHGRDISERFVGDLQALNNVDAPDRTQVSEYWYEQSLLADKVLVKLGKMDANANFAYVDYGIEIIHSSPGFHPTIPLPTYPDPALGVAVFVQPADWLYVGGGVFDANGTGERWDFESAFHGHNDSFTIMELGLSPSFAVLGQELPGTYRVGGWYHSGSWDVFFDDLDGRRRPRTHRGNAGVYLAFDQLLFREHPDIDDDGQGLGAFFQFGWSPSAYSEISQYYGAGCQYVGLIPTRDEDITGVGMFHVSLSGRVQSLEQRYSETAVELFHRIQLTPWVSLKPDVQYIVNPGGDGRDALAAGVRLEFTF